MLNRSRLLPIVIMGTLCAPGCGDVPLDSKTSSSKGDDETTDEDTEDNTVDVFEAIYGDWSTDQVLHGTEVSWNITLAGDWSYTSDYHISYDDILCTFSYEEYGNIDGDASTIDFEVLDGMYEVTGCKDEGWNEELRPYTESEKIELSAENLSWSLDGDSLTIINGVPFVFERQ